MEFLGLVILSLVSPATEFIIIIWIILEAWPLLTKKLNIKANSRVGHEDKMEHVEWINNIFKHFWIYSLVPLIRHWYKMDMGTKSPRIEGVRFYSDINSVTLDLALNTHLQSDILEPLEEVNLSGIVRLTFKNVVPNNSRLFGHVQITLEDPWIFNFKFKGVFQILNFLNPVLDFLLHLMLCKKYSYTLSNPYAQSILQDKRWMTKQPVDKVVVIHIQMDPDENMTCSCLTCFSPTTFLSKGANRSKIKLVSLAIDVNFV